MKTPRSLHLWILAFFFSASSEAVILDFGATSFSQTFLQTSETKSSQTFASLSLLASLRRGEDRKLNFGWTVISASTSMTTSLGVDKFSSLDMGPALRWGIDEKSLFVLTVAYGVYAKGKFDSALGTSESLTGTSSHIKFSVEPQVTDTFNLGVSLNFYNPIYKKSVLNATESDVSYKGTQLFPALSLAYRF